MAIQPLQELGPSQYGASLGLCSSEIPGAPGRLPGATGDCSDRGCTFVSPRWRGDYGGKKQLWFPSNYVEELASPGGQEPDREVSAFPSAWEGMAAVPAGKWLCLSQRAVLSSRLLGHVPHAQGWGARVALGSGGRLAAALVSSDMPACDAFPAAAR